MIDMSKGLGEYVTRRQVERNRSKKVPVSFTMDRELYDFVDELTTTIQWKDRSHVINAAVHFFRWTLKHDPARLSMPQSPPQSPPDTPKVP